MFQSDKETRVELSNCQRGRGLFGRSCLIKKDRALLLWEMDLIQLNAEYIYNHLGLCKVNKNLEEELLLEEIGMLIGQDVLLFLASWEQM